MITHVQQAWTICWFCNRPPTATATEISALHHLQLLSFWSQHSIILKFSFWAFESEQIKEKKRLSRLFPESLESPPHCHWDFSTSSSSSSAFDFWLLTLKTTYIQAQAFFHGMDPTATGISVLHHLQLFSFWVGTNWNKKLFRTAQEFLASLAPKHAFPMLCTLCYAALLS